VWADLLFCSPHLCRLSSPPSPGEEGSHDQRLGAFAAEQGGKNQRPERSNVFEPLLSPLFGRDPSPVSADPPRFLRPRVAPRTVIPQIQKAGRGRSQGCDVTKVEPCRWGMAVLCLNGGTRRRRAGQISGSRGYDDIAISLARHGHGRLSDAQLGVRKGI
jgi:hypothetical protein